jgi:ATP-dependent RNA helicase DDX24/MAK5
MGIELSMLDKLKERVQLARQIENAHHKIKKTNHDRKWMRETAEAMEVELDSDFMRCARFYLGQRCSESDAPNSDSDEEKPANQKRKAKDLKNAAAKAQLKRLLAQPLVARGVSTRYITSGSTPIVDDLLAGECKRSFSAGWRPSLINLRCGSVNEAMVGVKKTEAGNDLVVGKKKKAKAVAKRPEDEEWHGIEAT